MKAEHLHEGDIILVRNEQRTVTQKMVPTVWLDDGTVLPRTVEVQVISLTNEEEDV